MRKRLLSLLLVGLWGCSPPPGPTPSADGVPSVSSPIAMSPDGRTVWVVNPDADTVTALDAATFAAGEPIGVGREPWSVAVAPSGTIVVMNRRDGSLTLLAAGERTDVPVGPEPGGLALSPSGRLAYVTVSSADEVAVVDLASRRVVRRVPVGRYPWAVGVTDDGDADDGDETLVVTHRLAALAPGGREGRDDGKLARLSVMTADGRLLSEPVIEPHDFGFPNVLEGLALTDDRAYVAHLLDGPEPPAVFHGTVSAGLTSVPLPPGGGGASTLHLNDPAFSTPVNFPRSVAVTADGRRAYVALAGSDVVMGIDMMGGAAPRLIGFWAVGSNPRGIVLDPSGSRAFVMNHLSRDVSVLDLADTVGRPELARVRVTPETLDPETILGARLFNSAVDPRLSRVGWLSCASCHPDGGSDGTTWQMADGPRQTMPLWRLEGSAPFHASATRDELQDVEGDIETLMGGVGLAPGAANRLLGSANGGVSEELDALAAFVLHGIRVPRAAAPDPAEVAAGRVVFEESGCAGCHGGPAWTVSSLPGPVGTLAPDGSLEVVGALRRVGTYDPAADVLGEHGFDVPTLLGLHASAPYLHDGSARDVADVLANAEHAGAPLSPADREALRAFLLSIDEETEPVPLPRAGRAE
ncbi:MAG TPA: hypothetical protein VF202_09225 [Trueperaceae bacterium]